MKAILAKIWKLLRLSKNIQLFIMRFLQDQFLIGVTGIFFNGKNEILVFKHSYRQNSWSLPGGYLKAKEHPAEGLEREIHEESAFTVSADEQMITRTDRGSARLDLCYIGKFIGGEFKASTEVTEYGFFSFENLPLIPKSQLFLIQQAIKQRSLVTS